MSSLEARAFTRKGNTLVPADIHADELLAGIPESKEVLVTIRRPRSIDHHKFFFAMLAKVVKSSKFGDVDELLDAIKLIVGHADMRMNMDGTFQLRPRSIDFASMDEEAFKRFKKRALWAISTHLGINAEALMEEVDADQRPTRTIEHDSGAGNRTASSAGVATGDAAEQSSATESPPAPSLNSEAAIAPEDTAAGKDPKAIPPKEAKPAAGLSTKEKVLLRKYAAGLADANLPRPLSRGSSAFLSDYGITEGTPAYAAATTIYQAHLARVNGTGSPAEADAVVDKVLA